MDERRQIVYVDLWIQLCALTMRTRRDTTKTLTKTERLQAEIMLQMCIADIASMMMDGYD